MIYEQPRICPREWDAQTPLEFWDTNGSTNLGQTIRFFNNQQKEKKKKKRELAELWTLLSKIERKWKEGLVPGPC